jgi:hypothetical protein
MEDQSSPTHHIVIDNILDKLMDALASADDIEGSVILVFDLVN